MVRLTIPVVLGVTFALWTEVSIVMASSFFAISTCVLGYLLIAVLGYDQRWLRGVAITTWMMSFGLLWMTVRDHAIVPQSIHHQIGNEGPWLVRISTLNRLTETQLRADAQVLGHYEGGEWQKSIGTIMLTLLRQNDDLLPRVGDRMLVEAPMKKILRIPDPGGFDRQVWASARGIEMELFATWNYWRRVDHTTNWFDHFSAMRQRLAAWVDEAGLTVRERALVKALVLGQRDELDSEQRTSFAHSGTIHVLAVSGMHVGLIYAILGSLFSWMGGRPMVRIAKGILVLVALWTYAGITGGAPSILRATVMFSFITLADMTSRRTEHFNSLFAAMFLLVLLDPRMIGIIGFQLSFLAVLGILMFFKPLEDLWTPRSWIMRKVWSLAVLSIAAQSLTTPVSLYYFKAFPVWFLPANLIVVTAVVFSVYASIALIVLHKIPIIGAVITWVLTFLLRVVSGSTELFASLPYAYPALRIDLVMVALLYVVILAFGAWWMWHWRSMRWLSATAFVLFLFSWGLKARDVNRSNVFTLYDERVGVMASITRGREQVVMVDPDRLANDPYIERKISQHRKALGLISSEILPPLKLMNDAVDTAGSTVVAAGRWSSGSFDVLFVNSGPAGSEFDHHEKLDAVILHDMEYIPEELLTQAAGIAEHIVIAGKTHWRARERAFAWCVAHGIPVHDVFAQGAFILHK